MNYYSTKRETKPVSFKEAVFRGLPEDNGLFMPEFIPRLPAPFFDALSEMTLPEIGYRVLEAYTADDIPAGELKRILKNTFTFDIPLTKVEDRMYSLELFHGPTLAFKDVGARFLAQVMSYFSTAEHKNLTVLVATSGDTGSAVANGFYNVPGIEVVILYPSGKISAFQEQQMTTLGGNITALEIDGTFDDCQHLVKQAFLDKETAHKKNLTSANSINIARLLPQSIYYFYGFAQLAPSERNNAVFAVPSGNYGNITAGLIAQKMGLPVAHFLACSNINDTVPQYLATGNYHAKTSVPTISNAMDVGNPSNFVRMADLYGNSYQAMTEHISGFSFTDDETKTAIKETYNRTGYILDPHGAVAYLGLKNYLETHTATGVFLETAHPVKFDKVVEQQINIKLNMPQHIEPAVKEKKSVQLGTDYTMLREYLLS